MKPVILLSGGTGAAANGTPTWALNQNYADTITRGGGIPLLAVNNDCAEEYADLADALLLSGGKDVATEYYGQKQTCEFSIVDPLRDDLEMKLIKAFVYKAGDMLRGRQKRNTFGGGNGRAVPVSVYDGGLLSSALGSRRSRWKTV